MPKPKEGESKQDFMSRAIPILIKEGKDKDQASAIAASMYEQKSKKKETSAYAKIKEETVEEEKIDYFYGMTTLPDRTAERLEDGRVIKGEILDKKVLDTCCAIINDESKMSGPIGSHRTIGLFHDRVHLNDLTLDEAGFVVPGLASVEPLEDYPGHYGLKVGTKVNKMYTPSQLNPDYTSDKIQYKIDNKVMGLSMEYNNTPDQERIVETKDGLFRYITGTNDFRGFSYARANLIGNPTAVSIKEIRNIVFNQDKINGGKIKMADNPEEIKVKLKESEDKVQVLTAKLKELESAESENAKVKELSAELTKVKEAMVEQKLSLDDSAAKIKESIELAFAGVKLGNAPLANEGNQVDPKLKEIDTTLNEAIKTKEFTQFIDVVDARIKEQQEHYTKVLKKDGIDMADTTLKVKCVGKKGDGRYLIVKTKDVIDSGSMDESTYYQTNAMFADKYVPGIVETFLKSDSLLTAMPKESYAGGNDKYQWRIWTEFDTFLGDSTAAVDPDVTAVETKKYDFLKLESPIREYRQAVEVTDFTQYHSQAAVGDLLMLEAIRAAEVVTNSLNADLFKGKVDGTAGWLGVNGLIGIADYSTHGTLYGRTRTSYPKLYNANAYDSTAEAISIPLIREGYTLVQAQGTNIADMAIVTSPDQWVRILNTQDNVATNFTSTIRHEITMGPAPAEFGFRRNIIPHVDGIPVILDQYCRDAAGNKDMFCVVDMSGNGLVLIDSKPIGMRGLAKVGTTEKVYVNWYGTAVYKRPNNIYVHDDLTLLGA